MVENGKGVVDPISIGGSRIPIAAIAALEARMRQEPFTTAAMTVLARDRLAASGGPISVCHLLAERVIRRAVNAGRIVHHGRDGKRVIWRWRADRAGGPTA